MVFEQQHTQIRAYDGPFMFRSNNLDCTNQNMNQTLSDTGNAVINFSHKYSGYQNGVVSYRNWYNTTQNFHAPLHIDFGDMVPPPYGCLFLPSSYSTSLSVPWASSSTNYLALSENQAIGVPFAEYDVSHNHAKIVGKSSERENEALDPEYYYSASATSEFSSSYTSGNPSRLQSSEELHEIHESLHSLPPAVVPAGSFMSVRTSSFNLQPESAYQLCPNGLPPTYLHAQCFGPSRNGATQVGQNSASSGYSYWNVIPAFSSVPGRYLHSEYLGMASNTLQGYKDTRLYAPLSHQDERLVQDTQVHSHICHNGSQIPGVSYQPPTRHFQPGNGYPSLSEYNLVPRLSPGQFASEQIHSSFVQPVRTPAVGLRNTRSLSLETNAAHEVSSIYDQEDTIDEHREMRLDIDGMSYEELLALEEQIGDVHTGLTEEFVMKNIITTIHSHKSASSPSDDEFCVVCQVEYNDGDSLGILSCGHKYHSSCIREWLLIKNLCAVCKKSGLATGRGHG